MSDKKGVIYILTNPSFGARILILILEKRN